MAIPDSIELKSAVETLLYNEALLLDSRQFEDWVALFTEDACYWIPLRPEQCRGENELSIIYDDIDMMRARVHWLNHPKNHAQACPSRTIHAVSNVLVESINEQKQEYTVSSVIQVVEYQNEKQTTYAGRCTYVLRKMNEKLKIAAKRVDLINSQAVLNSLSIPL